MEYEKLYRAIGTALGWMILVVIALSMASVVVFAVKELVKVVLE
jgi:hypothetical protein